MDSLDLGDGRVWTWPVTQTFEIERILDKRMVACKVGTVRAHLPDPSPPYPSPAT